jgi:hypothetical protein
LSKVPILHLIRIMGSDDEERESQLSVYEGWCATD